MYKNYYQRYLIKLIFKKKYNYKILNKKKLFIASRNSSLSKLFKKSYFYIWKGLYFNRIVVNKYNINYKFGEFSTTRRLYVKNLKKK